MSRPKSQTTKTKQTKRANIEAIVQSIVSKDVPEYQKILLQIRAFKEKKMYSIALQLFNKGRKMIQAQLQTTNDIKLQTKLNLTKARYYHHASSIFYEMNKYIKAISYSTQALHSCKGLMDNNCIEMMRFKEVLASSYKAMEQFDDALTYYEPIYYGLNLQIETIQKKEHKLEEWHYSIKEVNIWKGCVTYNIAMIYNAQKKFKKASKFAKECCIIRSIFESNTSNHVLSLILVSVIVSCPQIGEYKLSLDNLEKTKTIINSDKTKETKQYLSKVQTLTRTVLTECVRWSKVTNTDLEHYLKSGKRKKSTK